MALTDRSAKREQAAIMLADDRLTDEKIAEQVGIARSTLMTWKADPEFKARVREHAEAMAAAALSQGIAQRWRRLRRLNRDWERAQRLIDARGEALAHVPGGDTGLLAHDQKGVGQGLNAQVVDVYRADTGLLAEIRAMEKQAAEELGQWVEKVAPTSPDGSSTYQPELPDLSTLTNEELATLDALFAKAAANRLARG